MMIMILKEILIQITFTAQQDDTINTTMITDRDIDTNWSEIKIMTQQEAML